MRGGADEGHDEIFWPKGLQVFANRIRKPTHLSSWSVLKKAMTDHRSCAFLSPTMYDPFYVQFSWRRLHVIRASAKCNDKITCFSDLI
jgi:hypothetical protein